MVTARQNEPITSWEAGDKVQGFALVRRKELRQDKNGRDFLDLELADASGSIAGKAWSGSTALEAEFDLYDFVAFKGKVSLYRDQLQLSLEQCRRVTEADREHGFDEALVIPSTQQDVGELWRRLEELYEKRVGRAPLRRLARETLATHADALREHPAAKSIHHAYRGGLLEHVLSMAELALAICDHYEELDRDLVLLGILFHDLGKIRELGAMPANEYTLEGRLVGHVVIGRDLLRERCAAIPGFPPDLQLHLEHLILAHQGRLDFGSPVEPMTGEALALHFIDDLDSKLNQLRRARQGASGLQFLRPLGRYVYLGEAEAGGETPGAEETPEVDQKSIW